MLEIRLCVVNKKEYEENKDYRAVVISLPRSEDDLKRDFDYLGLDYNNLAIQDSHVLYCEFFDKDEEVNKCELQFSEYVTIMITNVISKAKNLGYTTPYQDIKDIYDIIQNMEYEEIDKLIAILKLKEEQISNMKDVIIYAKNLDCFELLNRVFSDKDYGKYLIENGEINAKEILYYIKNKEDINQIIDLEELAQDHYCDMEATFTEEGFIFQKKFLKQNIEEETEEFE